MLVQPGRPDRRHRPAHLPRLLLGLPRPAGPARHDGAHHAAGPVRRDRPRPRGQGHQEGQAPPDRAAGPAAYAAGPGPVSVSISCRTGLGGSPRAGHALRRPGRSGGGYAAVRRLARPAGAGRADPPGAVGPVLRLGAEHRGRRRLAGAGRRGGEDRPARQEQRGRHRGRRAAAGRAARRRGRDPAGQARRPGRPEHQGFRHRAGRRTAASASRWLTATRWSPPTRWSWPSRTRRPRR